MERKNELSVWEVFNEYADARDLLEDAMTTIEDLEFEIGAALDDLSDEIESISVKLAECDSVFRRFKRQKSSKRYFDHNDEDLPWVENNI
jgi:DNA repair ATPase RecN